MVILQGSHIPLSSIPVEQTAFGIITALSNWELASFLRQLLRGSSIPERGRERKCTFAKLWMERTKHFDISPRSMQNVILTAWGYALCKEARPAQSHHLVSILVPSKWDI